MIFEGLPLLPDLAIFKANPRSWSPSLPVTALRSPQPINAPLIYDDLSLEFRASSQISQFQPQADCFLSSLAQLSTTTSHNAFATRAVSQGHLITLNYGAAFDSARRLSIPFFRFLSTAESRACHSPRCTSPAQANPFWRVEGSGPYLPESVRTPWGGFEECEEVWRLVQNEGDLAQRA